MEPSGVLAVSTADFAELHETCRLLGKKEPASNWHLSFKKSHTMAILSPRLAMLRFFLFAVLSALFTTTTNARDTTSSSEDGGWILVNEISRASNQSLLWGPYRPNLYFGVKPRIPNSLIAGLMWSRVDDFKSIQNSQY